MWIGNNGQQYGQEEFGVASESRWGTCPDLSVSLILQDF